MIDKVSLDRIDTLHPAIKERVKEAYLEACERLKGRAMLRIAYTLRSFAEQDSLYAQGRTKPGSVVTWAKGGESYHNYGLAWDIILLVDKDGNGSYETASWETNVDFDGDGQSDWREVVEVFTRIGAEWGGNWNKPKTDMPHFQITFGQSIHSLQQLYNMKRFIVNTNYLAI